MSDMPNENKPEKGNGRIRVVLFAIVLSVICSSMITLAAVGLKPRQDANMALDKKINILKAAGLVGEKKPSAPEADHLYQEHIQEIFVDPAGKVLEAPTANSLQLYFKKNGDDIAGYILPIDTKGLWGKIRGYLAFQTDGQTVSGFSVFSHSETPGLGGEIESAWFQNNFKGKKIINSQDKFVSVGIAKGKVSELPEEKRPYYVDGISGATLTGKYLTQGIRNTLVQYDPVSIKFRQKTVRPEAADPDTGE